MPVVASIRVCQGLARNRIISRPDSPGAGSGTQQHHFTSPARSRELLIPWETCSEKINAPSSSRDGEKIESKTQRLLGLGSEIKFITFA